MPKYDLIQFGLNEVVDVGVAFDVEDGLALAEILKGLGVVTKFPDMGKISLSISRKIRNFAV